MQRPGLLLVLFLLAGAGCKTGEPVVALDEEADAGAPAPPDAADMPPDLAAPSDLAMPPRCTGKLTTLTGTVTKTMMSRGQMRTYLLHIPAKYDPTIPTTLVVAFHGLSDHAVDFIKYIDLENQADAKNVIALVPQGLGFIPSWNAGGCCFEAQLYKIDDVGFTKDMIDATRRDYCVDDGRIYAMGFSNGGMLAHRLACELSGTLSAVGSISGPPVFTVTECKPERVIPLLHMHGTADPIIGYHGGGTGSFPDIPMAIAEWAQRNRCVGAPKQTYKNGDVSCDSYTPCADKTEVTLCTIDKGKHTWPGSSDGTPDIQATPVLLDFFAKYAR
jgi:polyhydroxybutyrate depolymerase